MAKVNVQLRCTRYDSNGRQMPGDIVSLEKKEAENLVATGLADYPHALASSKTDEDAAAKKAGGKRGKQTGQTEGAAATDTSESGSGDTGTPDALDPDALDRHGRE